VAVETSPVFKLVKRAALFKDIFAQHDNHQNYDIHPVNEQFIMIKQIGSSGITVVLNWVEELKRLVPPGKR